MSVSERSIFERHPRVSGALIAILATGLVLTSMEFAFRWVRDLVKGSPWIARAENIDDPELGWVLNPDKRTITKQNACGEVVVRETPPGKYLVRVPGTRGDHRVLFLGDSFTQGTEASTDRLYHAEFERLSNGKFSVFAAGVGGYGTAQEYLLLKRVFDVANPEVLFWQLTSNDSAENVYVGKDLSTVQKPRPYFRPASGTFHVEDPSNWLLRNSELSKYLFGELLKVDRRFDLGMFGLLFPPAGTGRVGDLNAGIAVMDGLVRRVREEFPRLVIVGFQVDAESPPGYAEVFRKNGALYLDSLPGALRASGKRTDCAPADAHWNHEGNRMAGELLQQFARREVLPLLERNSR